MFDSSGPALWARWNRIQAPARVIRCNSANEYSDWDGCCFLMDNLSSCSRCLFLQTKHIIGHGSGLLTPLCQMNTWPCLALCYPFPSEASPVFSDCRSCQRKGPKDPGCFLGSLRTLPSDSFIEGMRINCVAVMLNYWQWPPVSKYPQVTMVMHADFLEIMELFRHLKH